MCSYLLGHYNSAMGLKLVSTARALGRAYPMSAANALGITLRGLVQ